MGVLESREFNLFLYHYERRRGDTDSVVHTVNRQGFATGEVQPYLTDQMVQNINKSFDNMTYKQKKAVAAYHKNKEK